MAQKKGAGKGTGGHGRRRLEGRGPTPPARERTGHPAARRAKAAARRKAGGSPRDRREDRPDVVVGRNPVVEALRAQIPATAMYVLSSIDADDRVTEAVRAAGDRGIPLLEVGKPELDRLSGRAVHQGLALQVPPYDYMDPATLLARAQESHETPLIVALDGVTDPHNLGAVVRSAAAFGAHGVLVPERRAAGMTAVAWKASAGAAARLPVARATNLVRTLRSYADAGLFLVGLTAGGDTSLDDLEMATDPLVIVVGSEGRGLARLTEETCDLRVSIPMVSGHESLNASVAAGVALAEVARRRRNM